MHFSMDGGILLKDSPEAQDQDEAQKVKLLFPADLGDRRHEVLDKKQQEQTEKDSQEAIDEDFDPPENEKDIAKCQCPGVDVLFPYVHLQEIPKKNPLRALACFLAF